MPISKTLSDPSTGHLSPIAPVRDTTASAIQQVGQLGTDLIDLHQQKQQQKAAQDFAIRGEELRQQAELLGEGFVNQVIPKFDKELNRFVAGEKQGRFSYDSLRLHAESLLKRYSKDATQEQRQKLRQVMDQALGIDPTGAGVSIEKAIQIEDTKREAKRKDDYIRRGGIPDLYGTPEGEAWYRSRTRLDQEAADANAELQLAKDRKEFKGLDAPRNLQIRANTMYHKFKDQVNAMVMGNFNKPINELTDADLQSIDPTRANQFKTELETLRTELSQMLRNDYTKFDSVTDGNINEALNPINGYIDLVLGRLDKKTTVEQLRAWNDTSDEMVRRNIINDPRIYKYYILTKFAGNVPISANVNSDTLSGTLDLASGRKAEVFSDDKDQRKAQLASYKMIFDSLDKYDKASDDGKEVFEDFVKAVSKESINDYGDMSQGQRDALIELMQEPNFATTVTRFTGEAEELSNIIRRYVDDVNMAMGARLVEEESKRRGGGQMRRMPAIGNLRAISKFSITSNGINITPTSQIKGARDVVTSFKSNYLTRFNKGIRALANMEGRSVQDVIRDLTHKDVGIPGLRKLFKEEAE